MNTTPDSAPQPPLPAGGFFAWIRGLGIVRGSDRWFAGVAGGIAAKAKIDPLIVRGVFVVLALLGGPGILLYLVGWLLLPDSSGRIRMEDLIRGRVEGWTIVALVVVALSAVPTLLNLFTPGTFGWNMAPWGFLGLPGWLSATVAWVAWIAIIVVGWIWLHRVITGRVRDRRAEEQAGGADSAAATDQAPFAAAPAPSPPNSDDWTQRFGERAEQWGEHAGQWGERAGEQATRWGNHVGKQADEWSERYVERHEARKLGAAHVVLTLALALLAGGITALWVDRSASFASSSATVPVALVAAMVAALAVFAVSIIVAGIRGRRTGWVGFLSACGVIALIFTSVLPWGTQFRPFGTMEVDGTTSPAAVMLTGNVDVDLSALDKTTGGQATPKQQNTFVVWQFAGNSTVTLPQKHPTVVDVRVLGGNIIEQRGKTELKTSGPVLGKTITANLDGDKNSSSTTRVTVYLVLGNARVVDPDGATVAEIDQTPDAPHITDKPSTHDTEKLSLLEADLSRVEWQLEEPGLSTDKQRSLKAERTQLKQDIKDLELEMAR